MTKGIINTNLFRIYFSKDKQREDKKFTQIEKEQILYSVKFMEETITKILSFSKVSPKTSIYSVPIIIEKVTKKNYEKNHKTKHGILTYPPIGSNWNMTTKYKGIEIKSKTAVISLCPSARDEHLFETIIHELIHAFSLSFLTKDGVNSENEIYFHEGLTEWLTQLTVRNNSNNQK